MSFSVRLFKQWKPGFIRVTTLRKVKSTGSRLIGLAVFSLSIKTLTVLPLFSRDTWIVIVRLCQVELIVDYGRNPLSVCARINGLLQTWSDEWGGITSMKNKAINTNSCII
jgi:hypothetical protein